MYENIKGSVFDLLPLSYDANVILLGLLIWLLSGLIFRLSMTRLVCVVPVILLGVAIEIADVMFLSQAPMRAVTDFMLLVLPVGILVFFQHHGWARA